MLKRLLIVLLISICCHQVQAQVAPDSFDMADDSLVYDEEGYVEEEETYDTVLRIYPITILPDTVAYWKNKKEFAYVKKLDSLLEASQKKEAANRKDRSDEPNSSWLQGFFNSGIIKVLLWMMAGIFVLAVLYHLFANKGVFRARQTQLPEEETPQPDEDILEQDFESLLHTAEKEGAYRLATRYHFLKTLQKLKDFELIEFSPEKTNSLYVREIPARHRNEFARLILSYEYVWYGKFDLSAEQYQQLKQQYISFNQKI